MDRRYILALERQLEWHQWTLSQHAAQFWQDQHFGPKERLAYEVPVKYGEMFYVAPEFCQLLESAVVDLPDCYLQDDWFPADIGFVWFEKPLILPKTVAQELICDFCSDPPKWRYPAKQFIHSSSFLRKLGKNVPDFGSEPDWAACDICSNLIEAGDIPGLIDRSNETFFRKFVDQKMGGTIIAQGGIHDTWLREDYRELLQQFFENRTGPREIQSVSEARHVDLTCRSIGWIHGDARRTQFLAYLDDGSQFFPLSSFGWSAGESMIKRVNEFEEGYGYNASIPENPGGQYVTRDRHEIKYIAALLLLMDQRILRRTHMTIERHQQKRFGRQVNRLVSQFQVVTLRRYTEDHGEKSPIPQTKDWHFRWIVRGHWRKQFYPSKGHHQPKWILPYIKGPENLPVKEQKRVFTVVR